MMQRSEMPERQSTRDRHTPASRRARLESRAPLFALGVVLLVFLVALGSSRSLAHVGGPGDLTRERLIVGNLIFLLVAVAVIPAVVYVLWRSLTIRGMLTLVLGLAVVGGIVAALVSSRPLTVPRIVPRSPTKQVITTAARQEMDSQGTAAALAPWIASAAAVGIVLLLVAAWVTRRSRTGFSAGELSADELASPRRELHELVGISIEEIERESDPRRAVIRAYAGMESTLARHDLGRRPFEAPGEYLTRAFAAIRLSRHPGERLTELFERARFSEHTIGPEMKRESIAALGELRNELEAKPR
jgi:hypothetical protein